VSEGTDAPLGRTAAFTRLSCSLSRLTELAEGLESAEEDRERRAVLLFMVTAAWQVRDQCTDAYEALVRESESGGLGQGVLE
jgi:hypothetical protein